MSNGTKISIEQNLNTLKQSASSRTTPKLFPSSPQQP